MKEQIISPTFDTDSFNIGHIDHQSTVFENLELKRIFKNEKYMTDFLLNTKSVLQGGNDNESREDWLEGDAICRANPDKRTVEIKSEFGNYNLFNPYYVEKEE